MKRFRKNMIGLCLSLFTCLTILLLMDGGALAEVDLDADPAAPAIFANEIEVPDPGSRDLGGLAGTLGDHLNATVMLDGATLDAATTDFWLEFELSSNATFSGTPSLTVDAGTFNLTSIAGGNGSSSILFGIEVLTDIADGTSINLAMQTLGAGGGVTVTDQETVTMTFTAYSDAGVTAVVGAAVVTGDYIDWADVLATEITPGTPAKIDVGASSMQFAEGDPITQTSLGQATLTLEDNVYWTDGAAPEISDIFSNARLVLTGDFATGSQVEGVDANPTTGTIPITVAAAPYDSGDIIYDMAPGGTPATSAARETTVTARFDLTVADNVNESAATDHSGEVTLCTLEKNGTTKTVMMIPDPAGTLSGTIRVTNTSGISGTVSGRLYYFDGSEETTWDGVIIGAGGLDTVINAHETQVLTTTNLLTLTDFPTTWDNNARLVLESTLPSMEVLSFITIGGVLTNVSALLPDGEE